MHLDAGCKFVTVLGKETLVLDFLMFSLFRLVYCLVSFKMPSS